MPFAGFDSFEDCLETMTGEEGHDQESAENICGALQAEAKSDMGDPDALREALQQGAGLIADVGVDLVSGVDVPAVDSAWVMTKSADATDGHDYRAQSPILLKQQDDADDEGDEEQRISYAAAMVPREPDKEGDVVATPTVEKAAHDFLKQDGGVDTDHSLIDGEGEVVESWVLKDERTFDLPGGETKTYGPGTWMVGIEWGPEPWQRVKAGDITGLSIYGKAEHVTLKRCDCDCGQSTAKSQSGDTHKTGGDESDSMAPDNSGDGGGDADGAGDSTDDGPTLKDLQSEVAGLGEDLAAIKEAVETEKQGYEEAAEMMAEETEGLGAGDIMDLVQLADGKDIGDVLDAIDSVGEEMSEEAGKEDDEEYDDEEKAETAEKRASGAKLDKGADGRQTAAKGITGDSTGEGGMPSYKVAAEEEVSDT